MPITINGSGTLTGISVGGLPDGTVTTTDCNFAPGKILKAAHKYTTTNGGVSLASSNYVEIDTGARLSYTPAATGSILYIMLQFSLNYAAGRRVAILGGVDDGSNIKVINDNGLAADPLNTNFSGTDPEGFYELWRNRNSSVEIQSTYTIWGTFTTTGTSALTIKLMGRTKDGDAVTLNDNGVASSFNVFEVGS